MIVNKNMLLLLICLAIWPSAMAQQAADPAFWHISDSNSIVWDVSSESWLPHGDNIEMSGSKVSGIIYYAVNEKRQLTVTRDLIFPQLRTYDRTNGVNWQQYRAY